VSDTPVPARFYPAGGDAHGHPARLTWRGHTLTVMTEGAPALQISADALQAEARGFNHGQWALSWAEGDARHLLIVDDSVVAPLRTAVPALFRGGQQHRQRHNRRFSLGLALLVALPLLLLGAALRALDPLTDRIVARVPASVEQHIGEAVLARTRLEGPMVESGPAYDALQTIGRRLTRPGEKLQFHLAERPDINAFAAPGGVVVVHTALMRQARSAEEVAGVLAHEIAHVELRHSLQQIVRSAGLQVIAAALFGDYTALGRWAAQLGELKFSRDAEREADQGALERLAEARIDPRGLLAFFRTLARVDAERGAPPPLLSTHPASAERSAWLEAAIAARPPGTPLPIGIDWTWAGHPTH
jgi:Zn-dependent protease with chaperone function